MRKILFRGKRIDNGKWMYGDLLHPSDGLGWSIEDFTQTKNNCHDVIPGTIGQYTGLIDKNGKKIFEADIINFRGDVGYVEFSGGSFFAKNDDSTVNIRPYEFTFCEVVGNVYDNSNFLEGTK